MTSRFKKSLAYVDTQLHDLKATPRRVGTLTAHEGLFLETTGDYQSLGGAVKIDVGGSSVRGEVVGFRGNKSLVMPFDRDAPFALNCPVRADGLSNLALCSHALLGRVIDGHGMPLDGRPPVASNITWPLGGKMGNPLNRARVTRPIDVGVRAINGLLTMGEGQRVAIMAGSGVGKSVLMGQMLAGVEADVIVVGLIGERSREVSDFIETKLTADIRKKTVVVAVPADHPPLLRIRAAMRATAIAEYFRNEGKRVFLVLDSLTRVAHAQREIGLSLGEPPTMKGYPPSALGLLPRLIERAGADRETGGSITAVYTVLADGDDASDPVVDTARAIVDGHIFLSRRLAEQGVYPAIDLSRSISRTMHDCCAPEHLRAAANFRNLWSLYEENRDLILMGAYASGADEALDTAVSRHREMLGFVHQNMKDIVTFDASVDTLTATF